MTEKPQSYRGRIAPSPTGLLHLGHARTFWIAAQRTRAAGGLLIFRNEDLDEQRSRPEFVAAMYEDLRWLGLEWQEGPFAQSERRDFYLKTWRKLRDAGVQPLIGCALSLKLDEDAGARRPTSSEFARMRPRIAVYPTSEAGYTSLLRLVSHSHLERDPTRGLVNLL